MKASADRAFINVTYFKIDENVEFLSDFYKYKVDDNVTVLPDFDNEKVDENVTVLPDLDNDTVPYRKGLIRAINFTDTSGMFATSERYISVGAAFEGHLVFPFAGIFGHSI